MCVCVCVCVAREKDFKEVIHMIVEVPTQNLQCRPARGRSREKSKSRDCLLAENLFSWERSVCIQLRLSIDWI